MFRAAIIVLLLGWQLSAQAQSGDVPGMPEDPTQGQKRPERPETEEVPQPPVLPEPMESGEKIEPEVTIIQKEDRKIEEYRLNGRLYMVKVTPNVGPAYYLIDRDGDGTLESRRSGVYETPQIPQWVIFSW